MHMNRPHNCSPSYGWDQGLQLGQLECEQPRPHPSFLPLWFKALRYVLEDGFL